MQPCKQSNLGSWATNLLQASTEPPKDPALGGWAKDLLTKTEERPQNSGQTILPRIVTMVPIIPVAVIYRPLFPASIPSPITQHPIIQYPRTLSTFRTAMELQQQLDEFTAQQRVRQDLASAIALAQKQP